MKDIFKKSFLEGFSNVEISPKFVLIVLLITSLISLYIFFINRIITRKTFYNKNFGMSLIGVALITSTIIITIQSSVVVSLGMVGALSIVRFRTAIKDPLDLMFLFWSISVGIVCGAGYAEYAIMLSMFMTVMVFVVDKIPVAKSPLIMIVNSSNKDIEHGMVSIIKKYTKYYKIKSRNYSPNTLDFAIELRTKNEKELIEEISKLDGVESASIISQDGEVTF